MGFDYFMIIVITCVGFVAVMMMKNAMKHVFTQVSSKWGSPAKMKISKDLNSIIKGLKINIWWNLSIKIVGKAKEMKIKIILIK